VRTEAVISFQFTVPAVEVAGGRMSLAPRRVCGAVCAAPGALEVELSWPIMQNIRGFRPDTTATPKCLDRLLRPWCGFVQIHDELSPLRWL